MILNDIFRRAAMLCGAGEDYLTESYNGDINVRALSAINTVLYDICELPPAENLSDSVSISAAKADAAVYGTAMFLSLAFGDTDKSSLFSEIYSAKRAACKSHTAKITDKMPKEGAAL